MAETLVYFNPRCSKCRTARDLLDARGVDYRLIEYLETPPTRAALQELAGLVEGGATSLVRVKEAEYAELGLADAPDDRLLDALAAHPKLLERPIVVHGGRAVVARPPELLAELFDD